MKDIILQQAIKSGRLGSHPFYWYESIDSTNLKALEMAKEGAQSGTIIVAHAQNSGRGRLGRSWISPAGTGLYVSIILRPQLAPEHLSKITLAAGVAVSKAIDLVTNISTMIKWPNDILADGKKIAGILSESTGVNPAGKTAVVLGIGINVNTPQESFPEALKDKASSLMAITGTIVQKGVLLKQLLDEISRQVKRLEQGEFSQILEDWKARDTTLGKRLNWLNAAKQIVCGIAQGPDENGHLQVKDFSGKLHDVLSGDITLVDS